MDTNLQLVSYVPHRLLMPFIDYYWIASTEKGRSIYRSVNVFPITMHTLIFINGDQPLRMNQENEGMIMPRICMIGMVIKNDRYLLRGNVQFIAVRFKPLGLYRFFNLSPAEFANKNVDFSLYGKEIDCIYECLYDMKKSDSVIKCLNEYFLKRLFENNKKDRKIRGVKYCLDSICKLNGNVWINDLYRDIGLSERGFRKLFRQTVGIPPKLYSRIIRFNYIFSHMVLRHPSDDLFDMIEKAGYFDQSHFLKEFKTFTGKSFTQFRSNFIEFDKLHRKGHEL